MIRADITIHAIAVDGLPDRNIPLNRLGFIFRGNVLRGYPMLPQDHPGLYADYDCEVMWHISDPIGAATSQHQVFAGITHWVDWGEDLSALVKPLAPPAAYPAARIQAASTAIH